MSTIRRIVVATDLSGPSWRAVDRALELAARHDAGCTVLHALGADPVRVLSDWLGARTDDVVARAVAARRAALDARLAQPVARHGVQCEVEVVPGRAVDAIRACVTRVAADLLVVGAHGQGFLQRVLLGSTASAVVRTSRCPVLVVKQPCAHAYRRVLAPVDLSAMSRVTVDAARTVAPDADLVLLHVFDLPFEGLLRYAGVDDEDIGRHRAVERRRASALVHEIARGCGLDAGDYAAPLAHGDPVRGIATIERRYDCDLVAVGKHGNAVIEDLLIGSVTERVLAESRSDVLVAVADVSAAP